MSNTSMNTEYGFHRKTDGELQNLREFLNDTPGIGDDVSNGTVITTGGFSRDLQDRFDDLTTVEDFGAVAGQDSTVAFQTMADTLGYVNIPYTETPYLIDSFETTKTTIIKATQGRANIQLTTPTTLNRPGFILQHERSKIENGIHIDGNLTSRSLVRLAADSCAAYITSENVSADADSTTAVAGIECTAGANLKFSNYGLNYVNTGQSNESVPRLCSTQNSVSSFYSPFIGGKDIVCGFLCFAGDGQVDTIDVENATDNGIYYSAGDVSVTTINYRGNEEAVVAINGSSDKSLRVSTVNQYGGSSSVLGTGNCLSRVTVDNVIGHPNTDGDRPRKLYRTRSGQSNSRAVSIGSVRGEWTGINFVETEDANGTIASLVIKDVNINWYYDPVNTSTNPSRWVYIPGARQYNIQDWRVNIVDTTDSLTNTTNFQFVGPTILNGDSTYHNIDIYPVDSSFAASTFGFRGINLAAEDVVASGCRWQVNIGPYAREATYNNGVRETVNDTPTTGYWKAGSVYTRATPVVVGGVGTRQIIYAFYRQVSGSNHDAQISGISDGAAQLSDWRVATHVTGT